MSIPTTGLGWRHTRQQQTGGEVAKASQSKSSAWSTSGGGGGGSAKSTGSPVSVSLLSIDMATCERKEATLFGGGGGGGVNSALTPSMSDKLESVPSVGLLATTACALLGAPVGTSLLLALAPPPPPAPL